MDEFFFKPIDPKVTKISHIENLQQHILERQKSAAELLALPQVQYDGCLVCSEENGQSQAFTAHGFPWIECAHCGHMYKKHMPDYDWILKKVRDHTIEVYMDEVAHQYRIENITRPKYDFVMRYHDGPPGRWLDLATGISDMPYLVTQEGWFSDSTELNSGFVDYAREHFSITPKTVTLDDYLDQFEKVGEELFDVIGAFGYYDMLPDPTEHMRMKNRLLKMGGLVGINLPNRESLTGAMAALWPDTALRPITHIDYSWFSKKSLLKMVDLAGFEPMGVLTYGLDIHELITRICEHAPDFTGSSAMDMMYDMFNDLQRTVDTADHGDQMLWCVRKVREL